ncbi:MAG: hypothetical protein U0931_11560 [Vulcanimicrobiota bacterium]
MAELLKRKLLPVLAALLCGLVLVAAALRGDLPLTGLAPLCAALLFLRFSKRAGATSLFADGLLTVFGLSLACLPIVALRWLASLEHWDRTPHFDLAQLERSRARLPQAGPFQLDGAIYFAHKERRYTRDYGWVEPIYSRRHPHFPGAISRKLQPGPPVPPFFVQLDQSRLDRLAHRLLPPPPPPEEIRYQVCFRQSPDGWLLEEPGNLYVVPCLERAMRLSLVGLALFSLGLGLLLANLGRQRRQLAHLSRWDRPL